MQNYSSMSKAYKAVTTISATPCYEVAAECETFQMHLIVAKLETVL